VSSLAWIDFDEAERQRAQRIMALFQERESRDELGLGAIRDSLADHLFPGTSTIQTRLRYMLFIPWIFRMVENRDGSPNQLMTEARNLEIRLANALKAGGEAKGVIGSEAGASLRRLPSSVYWAGLGTWGIRHFPGSIDSYFSSIRDLRRGRQRLHESEDAASDVHVTRIWHSALPPMPKGLMEKTSFRLTTEEAQFIIDRLIAEQPEALLTKLARDGDKAECNYIWEHPNLASFPTSAYHLVKHSEIFSSMIHGAALVYNLQLSELRQKNEWVTSYEDRLRQWADSLDLSAIKSWSLDDFWKTIEHPNHTIRPAAKLFVTKWLELVRGDHPRSWQSRSARSLIEGRERFLKTSQSRFSNSAVRDRWGGRSGDERLSFRWPQAKAHLQDLVHVE